MNAKYYILLSIISIMLFSCEQNGELLDETLYGSVILTCNSDDTNNPEPRMKYLFQIDGNTIDTIKSSAGYRKSYKIKTGEHTVGLLKLDGTSVYEDVVTIEFQKDAALPPFFIQGENLLVDDYDPSIIKPAPGKCLIRLIITDPNLPDLMNISFVFRNPYGSPEGGLVEVPLNVNLKNVSKTKFSEYVELDSPEMLAGITNDYYGNSYYLTGTDAVTGVPILTPSGGTRFCVVRLPLNDELGIAEFPSNSVLTVGIFPVTPPATIRIGEIFFLRRL